MRRISLLLICCCLGILPRASAQDDVVTKAMQDELDRSMKQLRLESLNRPYFIAYRVSDLSSSTMAAVLGSLTSSEQQHLRLLTVEVRVGDYALDNTNFLSVRFGAAGVARAFGNTVQLPLEDDYKEIRRQIWLATDSAYKQALEALAQKRAALENKTRAEDIPDFSKEEPVTSHESPVVMDLDPKRAEVLVRRLSAIFRSMPDIHRSSVEIQATNAYTRYLNSEGTEYTRAELGVGLIARAGTQAPDGMPLGDELAVYERSMSALPGEEQLALQIRDMGNRLVELRSAPLVERYNGPVLFEGEASAEIFGQALAPKLVASRRPVTESPQFEMLTSRVESSLQDRLGARVLPDWASVTDDPTRQEQNGVPLLGGYSVDYDGVRAHKTVVVENGILKTLLLSRAPVRGIPHSTGNQRGFGVAPSNLFLTVQNGLTDAALKQKLLSLAQQRAKPYAIVVRRLRNPLLGDPREMMASAMRSFLPELGGGGKGMLQSAVEAYEVFPDGHEKLIRNAQLEGLNEGSFKDLVAASSSQKVYSMPFVDFGNMVMGMFTAGMVPNQANPPVVSFYVRNQLLDDLTVNPPTGDIPKPPITKPPPGD
ncbi:MAG: metallopeptidase TldD-related protein [Terriglobia bacterium]